MPECEGCKKDVKRISKYEKTGQWLCETCEIVAPVTGVLILLTYEEGDTVASEAVLAKIQTDR